MLSFGKTLNNTGALIGPSIGIQAADGTLYFSMVFGSDHWLYWSRDYGENWEASAPVKGMGECSIAFLVDPKDGRIIMNCRTGQRQRAQIIWSPEGVPGAVTWPGIIDPGCQGSIINVQGILYTSNANTTDSRTHVTIRSSKDQGKSWSEGILVSPGAGAYSQLCDIGVQDAVGILFEAGSAGINYVQVKV